jgi:hypothetical protein
VLNNRRARDPRFSTAIISRTIDLEEVAGAVNDAEIPLEFVRNPESTGSQSLPAKSGSLHGMG